MNSKLLNMLIGLAIVLNVIAGWRLGRLYGPPSVPGAGRVQCLAGMGGEDCSGTLGDLPAHRADEPCTEDLAELNRRIGQVVEQMQRMGLGDDTAVIIRPDGVYPEERAAVTAGMETR